MFNIKINKPLRNAAYPKTDDVQAKAVKDSTEVILKNGFNVFRIQTLKFDQISAVKGEDGVHHLVGRSALENVSIHGPNGASFKQIVSRPNESYPPEVEGIKQGRVFNEQILASFGSEAAAMNALNQISKVALGVRDPYRWLKALVWILAAYILLSFAFGVNQQMGAIKSQESSPSSSMGQPLYPIEPYDIQPLQQGEYQFKPQQQSNTTIAPQLSNGAQDNK
jgi:hypothetical protein